MNVMQELAGLRTRLRLLTLAWLGSAVILVMAMGGADATASAVVMADAWRVQSKNTGGTLTPRLTVTDGDNAKIKVLNSTVELFPQATGSLPAGSVAGTLAFDSTVNRMKVHDGTNWLVPGFALFTGTANQTVAGTSITDTSLLPTGVGTATLPANFLTPGRTVRIQASGYYTRITSGAAILSIKIKLGGTTIVATGATSGTNSTARLWKVDAVLTCRTTGVTGTVWGQGDLRRWTNVSTVTNDQMVNSAAATTVNTTTSLVADVTASWSASQAGNSITLTDIVIESLN